MKWIYFTIRIDGTQQQNQIQHQGKYKKNRFAPADLILISLVVQLEIADSRKYRSLLHMAVAICTILYELYKSHIFIYTTKSYL